jgi:hypothetical protein
VCIVSNIGDMGGTLIRPWTPTPITPFTPEQQKPWSEESLEEFKRLLEAARKYDADTGQPECENPDKTKVVEEIEKVADRPAIDELQKEFARDLAGLRSLIESQCSVSLLLGAMRTIVERYNNLEENP